MNSNIDIDRLREDLENELQIRSFNDEDALNDLVLVTASNEEELITMCAKYNIDINNYMIDNQLDNSIKNKR